MNALAANRAQAGRKVPGGPAVSGRVRLVDYRRKSLLTARLRVLMVAAGFLLVATSAVATSQACARNS